MNHSKTAYRDGSLFIGGDGSDTSPLEELSTVTGGVERTFAKPSGTESYALAVDDDGLFVRVRSTLGSDPKIAWWYHALPNTSSLQPVTLPGVVSVLDPRRRTTPLRGGVGYKRQSEIIRLDGEGDLTAGHSRQRGWMAWEV